MFFFLSNAQVVAATSSRHSSRLERVPCCHAYASSPLPKLDDTEHRLWEKVVLLIAKRMGWKIAVFLLPLIGQEKKMWSALRNRRRQFGNFSLHGKAAQPRFCPVLARFVCGLRLRLGLAYGVARIFTQHKQNTALPII